MLNVDDVSCPRASTYKKLRLSAKYGLATLGVKTFAVRYRCVTIDHSVIFYKKLRFSAKYVLATFGVKTFMQTSPYAGGRLPTTVAIRQRVLSGLESADVEASVNVYRLTRYVGKRSVAESEDR